MLNNLYQEKVRLVLQFHPHCVYALRMWEIQIDRGLVERSSSFNRCYEIVAKFDPRQLTAYNVDQIDSDLDYVMAEAEAQLGALFSV